MEFPIHWLYALLGGVLIGAASTLVLWGQGRVLGISGLLGSILSGWEEDNLWRLSILAGLLTGGSLLHFLGIDVFSFQIPRSANSLALAGFLVGVGTRLGSGCTSGHGVCGTSRLSPRSLSATLTFIAFGALTVFVMARLS